MKKKLILIIPVIFFIILHAAQASPDIPTRDDINIVHVKDLYNKNFFEIFPFFSVSFQSHTKISLDEEGRAKWLQENSKDMDHYQVVQFIDSNKNLGFYPKQLYFYYSSLYGLAKIYFISSNHHTKQKYKEQIGFFQLNERNRIEEIFLHEKTGEDEFLKYIHILQSERFFTSELQGGG
jgi:hypothetical protein